RAASSSSNNSPHAQNAPSPLWGEGWGEGVQDFQFQHPLTHPFSLRYDGQTLAIREVKTGASRYQIETQGGNDNGRDQAPQSRPARQAARAVFADHAGEGFGVPVHRGPTRHRQGRQARRRGFRGA